jgi:hypothetical protein
MHQPMFETGKWKLEEACINASHLAQKKRIGAVWVAKDLQRSIKNSRRILKTVLKSSTYPHVLTRPIQPN